MAVRSKSRLASFLRSQMLQRGWSVRVTQDKTGVSKTALYNILDKEDVVPELDTIVKLAITFDVPLWRIIELCGFDLQLPNSSAGRTHQFTALLDSEPSLQPIMEHLLDLEPKDLESVLAFVEGLKLRRERRQSS